MSTYESRALGLPRSSSPVPGPWLEMEQMPERTEGLCQRRDAVARQAPAWRPVRSQLCRMPPLPVLVLSAWAALFCNTHQGTSDKKGLMGALRTAHRMGGSWARSSICKGGFYRQRG